MEMIVGPSTGKLSVVLLCTGIAHQTALSQRTRTSSWKSVQANRYLRSEYSVVRVRFRVRVGRYLERLKADFQLESCCGGLKVGFRQA